MDSYSDFRINILRLREIVYKEILEYRYPLREVATQFLESNHLLDENILPRGISFYLPFWLGDRFGLSAEITESLSLANYYLTSYFITKDGIIDHSYNDRRILLLSDRLLISAINTMRILIDGNNKLFWSHFYECIEENINFLVDEEKRTLVEEAGCNPCDLRKAIEILCPSELGAFLKPSITAAAILTNREDEILSFYKAIDFYHFGLKLVDDIVDWEDDLEHHNTTLFLNFARNWCGYKDIRKIDVQRFIVGSDLTELMLDESVKYLDKAKESLRNVDCRYFVSFLDNERNSYLQLKNRLNNSRMIIMKKIAKGLLSIRYNHSE